MPAPLFVQTANSGTPSGTATSKTATFGSAQSAGNLNVVAICLGQLGTHPITVPTITVTDSKGNSYTPVGPLAQAYAADGFGLVVYSAPNIASATAGANIVTVTLSGAYSFFIISVFEYSGIVPASPVDVYSSNAANNVASASFSSGVANNVNPNDLIFGCALCYDGPSAVSGSFTQRMKQYVLIAGDLNTSASGSQSFTGTSTGTSGWVAWMVAFRAPAVQPPSPSTTSTEVLLTQIMTGSEGSPISLQDANSWSWWPNVSAGAWAQIDANVALTLTRIRLSPVAGGEDLVVGGVFKGSNDPAFGSGVSTIFTIPARPLTGTLLNEYVVNPGASYRYYRYYPPSANSAIADLDFIGINVAGTWGTPCTPVLSPTQGQYDLASYFRLSCLSSDAAIYYTLDGSTPSSLSTKYSGPLLIASSCTLSAIAISPTGGSSRVISYPIHIGATEVSVDNIYDDRGYRLWAMNGSLFQDPVSKYWYRYGNNADTPRYYNYGFAGNMCYRSADLRNWAFRGQLQQPAAGTADTTTNKRWHIAFHVLYNAANNNYAAWCDTYDTVSGVFTWVGKTVWTSSSPEGPFTLVRTLTSFPGIAAGDAGQGDFTLFLDTDGSAYLVSTMGNGSAYNTNLFTAKLTADFTNISTPTQVVTWVSFATTTQEAPWVFKAGSVYFLFYSATGGFNSSDCKYSTASSVMGAWSAPARPFQPVSGGVPDYTIAYDSQDWQVVTVPGRTNGFIYHGDRYSLTGSAFPNLKRIRCPVVITGSTMTINWFDSWAFDAKMPPVSGQPAIPGNLVVSGGSATWINNEPAPVKLYLDMAADSGFTQSVQSLPLPDGSTSSSNVPAAAFYRVRAVNASGSSVSAVAAPSGGVTPLPPQPPFPAVSGNPPFMPVRFQPTPPTPLVWEDGPGAFLNPPNTGTPIRYNGQGQQPLIYTAYPKGHPCVLPGEAKGMSVLK